MQWASEEKKLDKKMKNSDLLMLKQVSRILQWLFAQFLSCMYPNTGRPVPFFLVEQKAKNVSEVGLDGARKILSFEISPIIFCSTSQLAALSAAV